MFLSLLGNKYVVAILVFVLATGAAFVAGYRERGKRADAEIQALKSEADRAVAKAQEKAAQVEEKVVIQYRDRIKVIRETAPEVEHEIQVIRQSDCSLPSEWVRLYNSAGSGNEASSGVDAAAPISCADAIEVARENNKRFRENAEQLRALQDWARGVAG